MHDLFVLRIGNRLMENGEATNACVDKFIFFFNIVLETFWRNETITFFFSASTFFFFSFYCLQSGKEV